MRNLLATLFLIAVFAVPASARTYSGRGSKPDTSFVVYIPNKLDLKKRHPWILGFSPTGNGQDVVGAMSQACDDNGWILVASNNSRNGISFDVIEPPVLDTINTAVRTHRHHNASVRQSPLQMRQNDRSRLNLCSLERLHKKLTCRVCQCNHMRCSIFLCGC